MTVVQLPNAFIFGVAMRHQKFMDMIVGPEDFPGGSCDGDKGWIVDDLTSISQGRFDAEKYPFKSIGYMTYGPQCGTMLLMQKDETAPAIQKSRLAPIISERLD